MNETGTEYFGKRRKMLIRCAENTDYLWLKEHDHIRAEFIKTKIENREIYVAEEEEIAGWLRYNFFWDNVPFMTHLYLLEDYRNKGIGRKLVNHWENEMKINGYKNVLTSTQSNESGQHFYRKLGYVEIGGMKYLEDPYEIIFFKEL
jgi:ribosomal protein S18 acetylase RimI-like enzyme